MPNKRRSARRTDNVYELREALTANGKAFEEGPKRKHWSLHDLKEIKPLTRNQDKMFRDFSNGHHIVADGSAGSGKAQPLYSKVLTVDGWTTMGELTLSDKVVIPSGGSAHVIGIFPQGIRPTYEITFHDGSKAQSCAEHLWEVYVSNSSKKQCKQIIQLSDIISLHNDFKNTSANNRKNISVRLIDPVELSEKIYDIDPYSMGLLLGDGSFRLGGGNVLFSSADAELISHLSENLNHLCTINKRNDIDHALVGFRARDESGNMIRSPLHHKLVDLGLDGLYSVEKFIPDSYKSGSIDQRLSILQGLLDTDGTVGKSGNISYCTVSPRLAKDVQDIIWSMGGTCTVTQRNSYYISTEGDRIPCKLAYTLHIRVPNPKQLFRLTRKSDRLLSVHAKGRVELRKRIIDIQ